ASGTKGNPRQIKRFLNTLLLRQASAKARGFGDDIKLPVLAKLMLAERFLPRLFDQIATSAAADANGICADLKQLEEVVAEPTDAAPATLAGTGDGKISSKSAKAPVKAPETAQLTEWNSSPAFREWAKIKPAIGTLDLRPYLFVAKDRKDYFGGTTVL